MTKYLYGSLACLLVAAVALAMLGGIPGGAAADTDDVNFSHAKHKDLAECGTCHAAAESMSATDNLVPKPEACSSCHEANDVRTYWNLPENAPLDVAAYPVEDHKLRFMHKPHIEQGKMECLSCHAGVLEEDGEELPSMETCATCHNDGRMLAPIHAGEGMAEGPIAAANRCEACHTSLAGMTPKDHRMVNWSRFHGRFATSGEAERECAVCHSPSFCQECHTPTNDVPAGVAKDKFYHAISPRGEKMDNGSVLTVQSAHPLTYRYTHGFDARAQSSHCERCHEPESFCTPCHENGYDGSGAKIVPQSHQLAGFVTLGGSAAMNRHGKLAEMDIASCATCHNVDGGDPVCAACHSTGLVKGGAR